MEPATELVRLEIPAQPAFVGVARTVVTAVATTVEGIDDDRLEDLRIAVSEACTNAVESYAGTDGTDRVVVRCLLDAERLEVHIEDAGEGFGASAAGNGSAGLRPDQAWGVQLIRALVDDVAFTGPGAGNAVQLIMRRKDVD